MYIAGMDIPSHATMAQRLTASGFDIGVLSEETIVEAASLALDQPVWRTKGWELGVDDLYVCTYPVIQLGADIESFCTVLRALLMGYQTLIASTACLDLATWSRSQFHVAGILVGNGARGSYAVEPIITDEHMGVWRQPSEFVSSVVMCTVFNRH